MIHYTLTYTHTQTPYSFIHSFSAAVSQAINPSMVSELKFGGHAICRHLFIHSIILFFSLALHKFGEFGDCPTRLFTHTRTQALSIARRQYTIEKLLIFLICSIEDSCCRLCFLLSIRLSLNESSLDPCSSVHSSSSRIHSIHPTASTQSLCFCSTLHSLTHSLNRSFIRAQTLSMRR